MSAIYREFPLRTPSMWLALAAFVKANAAACIERGSPLRIIVTEDDKKRNSEQNKRLWGHVYQTIAETAWVEGRKYDKDVWHEYYAKRFGVSDEVILPDGEIITRRKSTTQMTVSEFCEYMNNVESHAATEFGVVFESY